MPKSRYLGELKMTSGKTYFPNLDGIRAFACLAVFTGHMFDYINGRHMTNPVELWLYNHEISGAGAMGVSLFFVLSGFLITYLLISEKSESGLISLKNFYLKRILRIWPMFFLVVALGFFIIPALTSGIDVNGVKEHLARFLLFTNNFDRIHTGFTGFRNDSLGVLWSVAVEEQFYLVWPLILLVANKKTWPWIMGLFIVCSCIFRYVHRDNADVIFYHTFSVAGDLSVGALVAWLGFYNEKFRMLFSSKTGWFKITGYLLFLALLLSHHYLLDTGGRAAPGRLLLTLGFGFIIADQCFSTSSFFQVGKSRWLSKFGWISYGFYCMHMFVIMIFQKLNSHFHIEHISTGLFYLEFLGVFVLTTILSVLSYHYFEGVFLRMKNKLAS